MTPRLMFRVVRTLILVILFSALTAAALLLWLSPDPIYMAQEWLAQGRYYAFDGAIREVAEIVMLLDERAEYDAAIGQLRTYGWMVGHVADHPRIH